MMKSRKTLATEGDDLNKFKTIHDKPGVDMVRNERKTKKTSCKTGLRHVSPLSLFLFRILLTLLAKAKSHKAMNYEI